MTPFDDWDWDDLWMITLWSLVLVVAVLIVLCVASDHSVRGYYMQHQNRQICLFADINWADDQAAYCSEDVGKVLQTLDRLRGGKQ